MSLFCSYAASHCYSHKHENQGVPVSGSVTYALVITVGRNMIYNSGTTRTSSLCSIHGHPVKLSNRASINRGAPYVNNSYRCEFFIFKFLCAVWRRLSLLRIKRKELYSKVPGTGNVGLLHCIEKIKRILVT